MSITRFPHGISSFGVPVLGGLGFGAQGGRAFFVDPVLGTAGNDGLSPQSPFKSITTAYAAATSDQNDVIFLLGKVSAGVSLAASLTWAKNAVHLIGVCAPTELNQRARIGHSANFSPMITVSGSGCYFANLYFIYGRGNAGNLINVKVTGNRNVFHNCHIAGPGNATEAGTAGFNLLDLNGGNANCTENLFDHCTIGLTTLPYTAACNQVVIEGYAARTVFRNCTFLARIEAAGGAGSVMQKTGAGDVGEFVLYRDCVFLSFGATAMTAAFTHPSTQAGYVILHQSMLCGNITDVAAATSTKIQATQYGETTTKIALAGLPTTV